MHSLLLNEYIAVVEGRDGLFLVNRNDVYIGKAIEIYGECCGIEGDFLTSLIKPGHTVIEVGANIGSHTVALSRRVGSTGSVFAYEPQRACFSLLQAQLALNQLHNVFAFNEGLGEFDSDLWMPPIDYSKQGNFGGISLEQSGSENHEKVRVRRIDDLFADATVNLIKIDVEGMEEQVLKGAQLLIDREKPILYVENDRVEQSTQLISLIKKYGYRLWWHISPLYNPNNHFNVKDNLYGKTASFNMLCIHSSQDSSIQGLREIMSENDKHPLVG
jgi:FkbM family methyltransferase